jgi:hypothetical protein
VADTKNTGADRVDPADAAQYLGPPAGTGSTIDSAFGPNWEKWQAHVVAHVPAPDYDNDGVTEMGEPVVPLYVYADGPNSYISTDVEAGQVIVRDGNDKTGKPWKWPLEDFMKFVAHAHGKRVPGEKVEEGDNPYEAARKLAARTAKLVQADRDAEASRDTAAEKRTTK